MTGAHGYDGEIHSSMAKILARAWTDASFKQQLLNDADGALSELGLPAPDGTHVRFVDDPNASAGDWSIQGKGRAATLVYPIPAAPADGELSSDQLQAVAGGDACCCCCTGIASLEAPY